ncbi:E3 ubiquitin-protein ligase TRIM39-like [Echeneis naucrates]|uniref:E3 ubiquitin-protein ligase TRIM39-like n=1 Tax=Echeneis naucrates TaxID=173247 RepID=A0A665VHC7_ECHNA|nr:E3 ubiquitin-protein ligase TRIM39-like [Echeneis naucrates]
MSSHSILASLPKDHLQCSLCLNIFSDPVTTPCGHNFCKMCLSTQWDNSELCQCPACNKRFYSRPEISTNTVIEEISFQIKKRKVETPETVDVPGQVKCDVCTELKFKAEKSCLVCLTSYCEAHLEPHHRVPSLMRHKLIDPVENLEERLCVKHEKILELFCRDEQVCICLLCSKMDHKGHDTVCVEEEAQLHKVNIEAKMTKVKMMIEQRNAKIEEFTAASETKRVKAQKEIDDGEKLFDALLNQVQDVQTKMNSNIQRKLQKSQNKDGEVTRELREEIAELQRKLSALEELSHKDDHLQLLQTLKALDTLSGTRDWTQTSVYSDLCVQTVRRAMSHLVQVFTAELKTLTNKELTRMRQYKESVTFDKNTAGCGLAVNDFESRLKYKPGCSPLFDLDRFERPMILGVKGFTSGRHYWEVQVGLRNNWDVGVAKESVDRTGQVAVKKENGFFAIGKRGFNYQIQCTGYKVLHLCPRPRNIGIYLDYDEGRVSFYDVDEKLHIHSFTRETFTEKLFPYFYLQSRAKKSEPLVIRSMTDRASLFSLMYSLKKKETEQKGELNLSEVHQNTNLNK